MSNLIEIRVFRSEPSEPWDTVPVSAFLPVLIMGDGLADNVARRLKVGFFKQDPEITWIRWNLKGTPEVGHWVERETV